MLRRATGRPGLRKGEPAQNPVRVVDQQGMVLSDLVDVEEEAPPICRGTGLPPTTSVCSDTARRSTAPRAISVAADHCRWIAVPRPLADVHRREHGDSGQDQQHDPKLSPW